MLGLDPLVDGRWASEFERLRVFGAVRSALTGRIPARCIVDRYRIDATLGRGATGVVYRATDLRLHRPVALKFIDAAVARGGHDGALAEALTLARLAHPNVVAVHDAGHHERGIYIVMDYVEGISMEQWLRGAAPKARAVMAVLQQAGRGLAAAHAAGVVHGDFKPANVMIAANGRVQVIDFGLADVWTSHREAVGTPAYMAPEVRSGARPTPQSDQYSFCVSFHEALTGVRPPLDGRPRRLRVAKPILSKGLAPRPVDRHRSMGALLGRFERRRRLLSAAAVVASSGLSVMLASN